MDTRVACAKGTLLHLGFRKLCFPYAYIQWRPSLLVSVTITITYKIVKGTVGQIKYV